MEVYQEQTYSERTYHGLPILQAEDETAIVTGANGVSGQAMLKLLLKNPRRWTIISAISKGKSPIGVATDPWVQYIAAEFLDKPDSIANVLEAKAVTSGHCFFLPYKDSPSSLVMQQENGAMLENFSNATHIADPIPKRIVLQTGRKHYGVTYLNLAIALGLYLAVSKEFGDAPVFNGNTLKYHSVETLSPFSMNAFLEEWFALSRACANQAFNATNGDSTENELYGPAPRPLIGSFPTVGPLDYKENDTIELRNSLQQWAKEKRTLEAWERLSMREGLDEDTLKEASWGYADRNIAIKYSNVESLTKARRFGFLGYLDSTANFLGVLNEASDLIILPRSRGAERK